MDLRVPQDNGAGYATLWSQLIRQWLFVHAVNVTLLLAFTHCMAPSHSTFLLAGGRLRPPPVLDHGKDITKSRTVCLFHLPFSQFLHTRCHSLPIHLCNCRWQTLASLASLIWAMTPSRPRRMALSLTCPLSFSWRAR